MKRFLLILIIGMISSVTIAQTHIIVAGDNVCLRHGPSESTKMTGPNAPHFYTGQTLPYYGKEGNYYKVKWNGGIYYFPVKYARLRGENNTQNTSKSYSLVVVAGDDVCLRSAPNENSKITSRNYPRLFTGELYPYYGTVGNYYKIKVGDNFYYIPTKYGRLRQ
jgi:uncharacterized protein YgiM (DUF1202 family)